MKKSKKNRAVTKERKVKAIKKSASRQTSAGKARVEGMRFFRLAGRPTREQFQLVYGERGHLMTWSERAKAGIPASKFQAALKSKQSER